MDNKKAPDGAFYYFMFALSFLLTAFTVINTVNQITRNIATKTGLIYFYKIAAQLFLKLIWGQLLSYIPFISSFQGYGIMLFVFFQGFFGKWYFLKGKR